MNVIDNILLEWAYRCPDGIVDVNNPEKAKILFEILNEIDSKQELIDLINTSELSPEQINKLKKYVAGKVSSSDTNAELEKIFALKGLKRIAPLVIYLANNFDIEDELLAYMQGNSQPTLSSGGNLFTLFSESGLPEDFLKRLAQTTSNQLGAGELLLVTMLKNAKKLQARSGQGDIQIGDEIIELKGKGAALSEWGSKAPIKKAFLKAYGITDEKELSQIVKNDAWLTKIGEDLKSTENKEKAENVLRELYPNFKLNTSGLDELKKSIVEGFVDQYFKDSKVNSILVLDETTGNYKKFSKDDFKQAIGNEIQYFFTKDTAPRIYLSDEKTKTDENLISELYNTDHFQLRTNERGNVLDIVNINELPLKDYKQLQVKEKLINNISAEIKNRAEKMLGKDVPSSVTYNVGIKLLKPVLVVDDEEYPIRLFAISTKEIKNEKDEVIGIREVENRGTLYLAIVIDNKVITLLLLDKEDDNELYFQVKKHAEKKNRDKEAKILTSTDYIYKIDLDELMGKEKEKQDIDLIDPATLEYIPRTDYRKGANFTHKKYGTGKIINTSSGSGGEGDSRGKLDWIEVDFGKPVLKGGKLMPYRRIENILTLVSPLIKK